MGTSDVTQWTLRTLSCVRAQALRRELMRELRRSGRGDFAAAELICGELLGNAARHARGTIRIALRWFGGYATITIHDEVGYVTPEMALPANALSESGRGLFIVQALAVAVSVEAVARDGTVVEAILPVVAGDPEQR